MSRQLAVFIAFILVLVLGAVGYAADGTAEGPCVGTGSSQGDAGAVHITEGTYLVTPSESVTMNQTYVWRDNRHRAWWSIELLNVDGFLLFDVSGIPDTETVVSMTLRCYLENAYGSPNVNPVVDVYYGTVDGWERSTVPAGALSLDALLVDDVLFHDYVSFYDFNLDVGAHDWSIDLLDDQICIGFRNDAGYHSYVYFFGAYGDPVGPPPELTIVTSPPSPAGESSWSKTKAMYR